MDRFECDSVKYSCVEQGNQTATARTAGWENMVVRIMESSDPKVMKSLGDEIKGTDWISSRPAKSAMWRLVRAKFTQCILPQDALLRTDEKILAEANAHGTYWGVGMSQLPKDINYPQKFKGQNVLMSCYKK